MVIDSIVWAVKHTDRNISEMGLEILQELLTNIAKYAGNGNGNNSSNRQNSAGYQFAQDFYKTFLMSLIADVLGVMTDRLHKSGFKLQASILMSLFRIVQDNQVSVPIFDTIQHPQFSDNISYLKEDVGQKLLLAFPQLNTNQIIAFITGCFNPSYDFNLFKQHLRDFLINVKEYSSGSNNDDLYDEEKKIHEEQVSEELRQYQMSVPGLQKPSELDYGDNDGGGGDEDDIDV